MSVPRPESMTPTPPPAGVRTGREEVLRPRTLAEKGLDEAVRRVPAEPKILLPEGRKAVLLAKRRRSRSGLGKEDIDQALIKEGKALGAPPDPVDRRGKPPVPLRMKAQHPPCLAGEDRHSHR